jgi:LacI family transcriptional regulator
VALYGRSTPLVGMGIHHSEEHDYVGVDIRAGTARAVRHLLEPGRTRVAYMFNRESGLGQDPRSDAYTQTMQEAGLEPEYILLPEQSRVGARCGIADYVGACGCPEAIFCINDQVALGCYRGLIDIGVRIPDDVALVGCDGMEDTEYLEKPMTTIVLPVREMCRLAWEYLECRIEDHTAPLRQTTLDTRLAIRESSGAVS